MSKENWKTTEEGNDRVKKKAIIVQPLKNYDKEFSVDGVEDSTLINFPIISYHKKMKEIARWLQDNG